MLPLQGILLYSVLKGMIRNTTPIDDRLEAAANLINKKGQYEILLCYIRYPSDAVDRRWRADVSNEQLKPQDLELQGVTLTNKCKQIYHATQPYIRGHLLLLLRT